MVFLTTMDPLLERRSGEHLSDIDVAKILALDKVVTSQREIASLVKCSRNAVRKAIASFVFKTFQGCNQRPEYKCKTTQREDRYIKRILTRNDSLPLCDIINIVQDKGYLVSTTTLRRRRSEAGYGSYIASAKPGLYPENVTKRLEWAMKYKDWTAEDCKCVIWSDE